MSFLTSQKNSVSAAFKGLILTSLLPASLSMAQLTNGVFDPSKVMVAKDRAAQVKVFEENIASATEFNRTLGRAPRREEPPPPPPPPREKPVAVVKKLEPPTVSANPISIVETDVSINGQLEEDTGFAIFDENDELAPLDDSDFASTGSLSGFELPQRDSKSGFLSRFNRSKTKVLDVPDRTIPIKIGGNNFGNPHANDTFRASPDYAPLFDDIAERHKIRDMTQPGAVPFGTGIAERLSEKPDSDTSQYLLVKEDTQFEPFKYGTEKVDKDSAFEIYAGMAIKDLGVVGQKRMVQIDSGESGLIEKFSVRQLSVSEEVVMANGLSRGRPWYSILDTDAEFDELTANLSSRPKNRDKPQRPWAVEGKRFSNGKPDSDTSQYAIVNKSGIQFGAFAANSQKVNKQASFEMPTGSIVKIISNPGNDYIVETDAGENGMIPTHGVRFLNDSEKEKLSNGISDGRRWYSILGTDPVVEPFSLARKTSTADSTPDAPKPKPEPQVFAKKPITNLSQYYVVKKDTLFEPYVFGTREIDTDAAFEMYEGATVRVIDTTDGKHIIETDSGEAGLISVAELRPLKDSEKEQMAAGISNGKPWYSIIDTLATE